MLKKILALCMAVMMIATCTTTAFAYEDSSAGSGETQILAHVYSSYLITIPATIDLSQTTSGEVTISEANIEDGYKVDVYITNLNQGGTLTLKNVSDDSFTIDCTFTNSEMDTAVFTDIPLVTFYDTELDVGYQTATKYFDIQVNASGIAGDYEGTMTYSFSCNPYS